jgi:GT2 family glycosyltransferase
VIACIDSLQNQERIGRIIALSDGSDKSVDEIVAKLPNVTVYRNVTPQGFIDSCKRAAAKSDAPYMLFLNSDTAAQPHAIKAMADNLDDSGVGVVGALLVYPKGHPNAGFVQHAGISIDFDHIPRHPWMGWHPLNPAVQKRRSINAVTGAALATRRDVWDKIGGFDMRFSPGAYEDCSYCFGVRRAGYEVIYEPLAVFSHWMHGSQTDDRNFFTEGNLNKNLTLLWAKHGQLPCDAELFFKTR